MGLKEIIEKRNHDLEEKLKAKDFHAAATFYTSNCVVLPSTGETVVGRDGLIKLWEAAFGKGKKYEVCMKVLEVIGEESSLISSRGSFVYSEDGKEKSHGNYVWVWKKVNDEYQIQYDIWNEVKCQ